MLNIALFFYIEHSFPVEDEINIVGKIIGIKEEKEYYDKYILKIMKNTRYPKTENQNVVIYVEKGNEYFPGDIVSIVGRFNKSENSRNYGGFNYNRYLLQNRIFGTIKCEYIEKIGKEGCINSKILLLRWKLCNRVDSTFNENSSQFLNGLLFGKIDGITDDIKENFEISNISHILAISGMHVIYVLMVMKFIINIIIKNRKIENMILIIFLFFFYILSGSTVSCLRACIMSSMSLVASITYKKNNFYISLIFSLIIILLINPYNLYNIGMWLSYFGTLGIVIFYEFIKRFFYFYRNKIIVKAKALKNNRKCDSEEKKKFSILDNIKIKVLNYIFDNFILSFSAQIFIFPIMVYSFNTISFTFFISNILVSILVAPTLIIGYLIVLLTYIPVLRPIYIISLKVEELFVYLILEIGKQCARLPFSRIYVSTPNFIWVIVYYIVVLILIVCFYKKRIYCLKLILSISFLKKEINAFLGKIIIKIKEIYKLNKSKFMKRTNFSIIKIFFLIIIIIGLIWFGIHRNVLNIFFIDVGQGDCTIIKTPKGKNIIIDGGEGNTDKYDYGKNVVLPYLLDRQITKIDYLIISHCDSDHIGGLFEVIKNIKVKQILIGVQPEDSKQFCDLVKIANEKGIKMNFLKAGDFIEIEKDIKINVLWPIEEKLILENPLNNNSLVFKLYYKKFSILFTGDIEEIAEKEIVELYDCNILKSNILKVAHHGSKTSSIKEFIEKVKPQIALIGVGKNNKFGHPSSEILDRFKDLNVREYRTDLCGEVVIEVKNKLNIYTKIKCKK